MFKTKSVDNTFETIFWANLAYAKSNHELSVALSNKSRRLNTQPYELTSSQRISLPNFPEWPSFKVTTSNNKSFFYNFLLL